METVSVSLEVLAGILGKNGTELQSALMTDKDGEKGFTDQANIDKYVGDALRDRLKNVRSDALNESRSAGRKSAFDEIEKHLEENFGLPRGTTWKDGIGNVVDSAKNKAATSEEAVKASEAYKKIAGQLQERESELTNVKKEFQNRIVQDRFHREIDAVISDQTFGLALPDDQTIRQTQLSAFRSFLTSKAKLLMGDDESLVPVDANGKQLEDNNFNPVSIRGFISTNAKQFWPLANKQPDRQAPPAGDANGNGNASGDNSSPDNKYPAFKSDEEFSTFLDTALMEGKDAAFMEGALKSYESQSKTT